MKLLLEHINLLDYIFYIVIITKKIFQNLIKIQYYILFVLVEQEIKEVKNLKTKPLKKNLLNFMIKSFNHVLIINLNLI